MRGDLWDAATGINLTTSDMLDADHEVEGVSDFGDDISDHCAVCGFAVGWREDTTPDKFGHTSRCYSYEVIKWQDQGRQRP